MLCQLSDKFANGEGRMSDLHASLDIIDYDDSLSFQVLVIIFVDVFRLNLLYNFVG